MAFRCAPVSAVELEYRFVVTDEQCLDYNYLAIVTGPRPHADAVPGLGPHRGHTRADYTLDEALAAEQDFARLLEVPGPAIVGVAPGSSCFPVACEFVLNLAHQLARRHLLDLEPITYVTPESFLGHFGIGGFGRAVEVLAGIFQKAGIRAVTDAGNTGLILSSDDFLGPRDHTWLIPGPEAHWAKVAFEKCFLATRRHGIVCSGGRGPCERQLNEQSSKVTDALRRLLFSLVSVTPRRVSARASTRTVRSW